MSPGRAKHPHASAPFPSKEDVLKFIESSSSEVTKREIARAFNIRGDDRIALKRLLREMREEGLFGKRRNRRLHKIGKLPPVAVVEIREIDIDGETIARPVEWPLDANDSTPPPTILMAPSRGPTGALGIGDRVLARLKPVGDGQYEGTALRRVEADRREVLGVIQIRGSTVKIIQTEKKARRELTVDTEDTQGATHGELVLAELLPGRRGRMGPGRARVKERLGRGDEPRSASLIAIHTHDIPHEFDAATLAEAAKAQPVSLENRTDLRDLPLITIDPADARDHDDAVWAEPDETPDNKGGWHVIVAIADVAHFVRPGTALDRTAFLRGNSAYFPDQVVPMLPEELSADLCSLKVGVDRPSFAAHLWFDKDGVLIRHRFERALVRIAGNLHYRQVQNALDGTPDEASAALARSVISPLHGAFKARLKERAAREPLNISVPEKQIMLDAEGRVASIQDRITLDAHRLVEEFMIATNVAAAETLEHKRSVCMYRVHEAPSPAKLDALREFLESLGYNLTKGQRLQPFHFNRILARAADTPHIRTLNTVVLRSQSQAFYGPSNLGHFGLSLDRYAHFTSPIRRYADLVVHRALIRALDLGPDGLLGETEERLEEIGEHISVTERRAMAAERDATDRYMAAYMKEHIGAQFEGAISGVTRFGLFVSLAESGAEGLVPIRTLSDDYYRHDEARHALIGERTGRRFGLGDDVTVRLAEAEPLTGATRFELLYDAAPARRRSKRKRRA